MRVFGTVLETGPGVKHVRCGDSVVLHWRPGAGIQSDPPQYRWRGETLNAGWVTTFNRHAVISENRCTTVPSNINPDAAALFGCAVTTGFGVVENDARLRMGESLVVFVAGGIGLNIIHAASLLSASTIIAVDLFDSRLNLAEQMGANVIINSRKENVETAIQNALSDQPLDVFIDNTGLPDIIEYGYRLTHGQGRMILVGVPRRGNTVSLNTFPLHFGKVLKGSHGGDSKPDHDIPRYLRLLQQDRLELKRLVTARYPLAQINRAIEDMRNGSTAGRVMIDL